VCHSFLFGYLYSCEFSILDFPLVNMLGMLLFQKKSSNQESNIGNVAKEKEAIKQHDGLVVVNKLSTKSINDKENEKEQISNNPCHDPFLH
jgi:hypothetical protein